MEKEKVLMKKGTVCQVSSGFSKCNNSVWLIVKDIKEKTYEQLASGYEKYRKTPYFIPLCDRCKKCSVDQSYDLCMIVPRSVAIEQSNLTIIYSPPSSSDCPQRQVRQKEVS